MAKLSKKQVRELEEMISNLKKVKEYIGRDDVKICRSTSLSSSDTFKNENGESLSVVDKQSGSEIVHLLSSIQDLEQFCSDNK